MSTNYPQGTTRAHFEIPAYIHEFNLTMESLELNRGHGIELAELQATVIMTGSGFVVEWAEYEIYGNNFETIGREPYVQGLRPEHDELLAKLAFEYDSKNEQNRTYKGE